MSDQTVFPFKISFPKRLKPSLVAAILLVIIVGLVVLTGVYVVDQKEEAVILRLGKYHKTTSPGLQFKAPLGVDRVYKVPIRVVQTFQFGYRTDQPGITTIFSSGDYSAESLMLTGDLNIVDVAWVIQYRVTDPRAWLFHVEESTREKTIRDISQSVLNQLVGDRAILGVMGSERTVIEDLSQKMIGEKLDSYGLGIHITTVKLQNIVPPKGSVQDAFEDVNKAIQDMNRLINEGKEAYNSEIPKASGQAEQMIEVAEGYATERINEALGRTARFGAVFKEYRRSPAVTRTRLYYEMAEKVFKAEEAETEILDKNLTNLIPLKNVGGNRLRRSAP